MQLATSSGQVVTRCLLACLLFTACEKAGGVEATGGASSHDVTPAPVGTRPKVVATLPNDAGVAVVATDAADAAPVDGTTRRDNIALSKDDSARLADLLAGDIKDDVDRKRAPGADLQKQIDAARNGGRVVAIGGGGGNNVRSIDAVGGAQQPAPTKPTGRISISSKLAVDDSTLTPDLVLAKIQSVYMTGVKRCYKGYLDKDPSARGKMSLRLTVNASGRAVNASAVGFARDVDDCITAQMANWRFPVPKDKDGEATEASFSIGLNMVPD